VDDENPALRAAAARITPRDVLRADADVAPADPAGAMGSGMTRRAVLIDGEADAAAPRISAVFMPTTAHRRHSEPPGFAGLSAHRSGSGLPSGDPSRAERTAERDDARRHGAEAGAADGHHEAPGRSVPSRRALRGRVPFGDPDNRHISIRIVADEIGTHRRRR
jgi:hypothetical protein